MISIKINKRNITIDDRCSLSSIIEKYQLDTSYSAIIINSSFIPKSQYNDTLVNNGDEISQITPMQGG